MASYWEKLKDPKWQKKRLEILNRDNWTCEICEATDETLHVHHGYYESGLDPWEYDDGTLHTLCESCHEQTEELLRDCRLEIAKMSCNLLGALRLLLSSCSEMRDETWPRSYRIRHHHILWAIAEICESDSPWSGLNQTLFSMESSGGLNEDIALGMGCSA